MSNPHPDSLSTPVEPIDRFMFSTSSVAHALQETEGLIRQYEEKLDGINREYTVAGYSIIDRILTLTRNKDELKGLATGLAKTAGLVAVLDELIIRKQTLELSTKDPAFFGWAFGDFTDESDRLVEELQVLLEADSD